MKKRVALIVSMMIILACLFVFSVSANEVNPDYNEQYVKTMTQGMLSVELEDGTSVDLYDAEGYTLCY
ncbi:MAG: hypothetical protein IKA02_04910, partial [Clostridia bacterium]|nr:hypothetical protein [Clostridia bacterium]